MIGETAKISSPLNPGYPEINSIDLIICSIVTSLNKNKIIQGYGYSSRLPVMNDPEEPGRYGEDGLNEHVHNYFVTVFARGGIILFIVTISYWFYLINEYRRVHKNNYILVLIIPALLNASFDVAMESVQFPYLLLLSIGYLFNAKQEFQNI